eukprot:10856236-Alexandrium_andersonii.AAC.1
MEWSEMKKIDDRPAAFSSIDFDEPWVKEKPEEANAILNMPLVRLNMLVFKAAFTKGKGKRDVRP